MTSACRLSRWTDTYLDGELSPEHTVDFEDHLSCCCCCQDKLKFEQALRFSMQRTARNATFPSQEFEAKLRALMAAERREDERAFGRHAACWQGQTEPTTAQPAVTHRPLTWRAIAPLSVAAAAALAFAGVRSGDSKLATSDGASYLGQGVQGSGSPRATDTMQTVQEFLDQLANDTQHNHELSSIIEEESEPEFVATRPPSIIHISHDRRWRTPQGLEKLGAIWEGLRYRNLAMHDRVPSLQYRVGGHRVLLWAYDSQRVPLRVVLEPRVALNHPVFVGTRRGLTIAAVEHEGQGFAASTDLSPSEAAELVVTAAVH